MRRPRRSLKRRNELMTCVAQVSDIAFGSIQLGDMPVAVLGIDVLGQCLARDYIPAKKKTLDAEWFKVGHAELPGASDQIINEVNRARTWFEYVVMSNFVDMVGLTPVHRKEAVHAIAVATRNIGLAAIDVGDPEVAELCVRFFNTYLRSAINRSAPTFASGIMNEYRRYAIGALEWRRHLPILSTRPSAEWSPCKPACFGRSTNASSRSTGSSSLCATRFRGCAARCGEQSRRATARWSTSRICRRRRETWSRRLSRPVDHRGRGRREVIQERLANPGREVE